MMEDIFQLINVKLHKPINMTTDSYYLSSHGKNYFSVTFLTKNKSILILLVKANTAVEATTKSTKALTELSAKSRVDITQLKLSTMVVRKCSIFKIPKPKKS